MSFDEEWAQLVAGAAARARLNGVPDEGEGEKSALEVHRDELGAVGHDAHELFGRLQPDSKTHLPTSWGDEFRRLGTKPIELEPGAFNHPDINVDTSRDLREAAGTQAGNSHGEGAKWEAAGDAS